MKETTTKVINWGSVPPIMCEVAERKIRKMTIKIPNLAAMKLRDVTSMLTQAFDAVVETFADDLEEGCVPNLSIICEEHVEENDLRDIADLICAVWALWNKVEERATYELRPVPHHIMKKCWFTESLGQFLMKNRLKISKCWITLFGGENKDADYVVIM